jgi:two-component system, OmpR family, sensor kinase
MTRLVDELLFLARAETDTIRFDWRKVELSDVLSSALQDARVLASRKQSKIVAQWTEAPMIVEGDAQRLRQAVLIALDNAVKYSDPESEVWLDAALGRESVIITVTDHGIGIPPEDRPYVFDRFYRGQGKQSRSTDGSGLGLPIARWIIEKHRGTVVIGEAAPRGTTLTIVLPKIEES